MSEVFERLMKKRGFSADFLEPKYEDCWSSWVLPDMIAAVARIKEALDNDEGILIYGDYDADGVTASAVLFNALRLAGSQKLEIMLPNRFTDGYGMNKKVVQRANETGVKLVITVDCGSRNHEIIQELGAAGVDTIVTDHHECEESLPAAIGVINAKRQDAQQCFSTQLTVLLQELGLSKECVQEEKIEVKPEELKKCIRDFEQIKDSCLGVDQVKLKKCIRQDQAIIEQLRELAGVGIAFKLAQALVEVGLIPDGQEKWLLDLVSIGTICDSMVLLGENRRLCYYGMKVLDKTRRPGLKELIRESGVKKLSSDSIGFQIGPRINAAGRMETAERALDLVLAESRLEAANLALELEALNKKRKQQQNAAVTEVRKRGVEDGPVIVEVGNWHEGILGIIAGRLTEEYRRPAFALAEVDGVLKGSGRSFGDFNLAEALQKCQDCIIGGGGHAAACGVKLEQGCLEDFRDSINSYYKSLKLTDQDRFLGIHEDLTIDEIDELSLELVEELCQLEPYGVGNEEPVFLLRNMKIMEVASLGPKKEHVRLLIQDRWGNHMKLMAFAAPKDYFWLHQDDRIDVWITLEENLYRGIRSVEGRIVKLASVDDF